MLGLGLKIPRLRVTGVIAWLKAFIDRVKGDGGTVEGKKCVQADGTFLIENKRANIIVDYMGDYAISQGGEGLEARACSAQAVNDLLYDPKPQAKFMFLAQDEGLALENYYCLSNDVDALEGALAVFGEVTHTYGLDSSAGAIALSVENGTAPYTYRWSNGATVEDITGLTKGVYNIQVTDSLGAIANNSFTVRGDADASIVTAGLRMNNVFGPNALTFPASGSASFNGTSDYVQLPDPFSYTNHTIAAWVYANDLTGTSMIFDSREANIDGIILYGSNTETINYQIGNGATSATLTTPSSYLNEWVFISGTYDGTNLKLYANGSIVSSSSTSISVSTAKNARIGGRSYVDPADLLFNGNLANVAIWNRALHPDEINSIMWKSYSDLNAVDKNGLQAWYALDDITGTTVPDSTGNHNGTAN
jgi:hypothetical protein